jgi:prepilin-type N-terminal cleavage/methylation domain-containing protein
METNVCRHWALIKVFSPTVRATTAQHGYTLVELLVGVTLGSVVLAFLGGVLLVSEVKVAAKIQGNLNAKDAANRAIDLIRREAASSRYFRKTGFGDPSSCSSSPVVFAQLENALICIKSVSINSTLLDAQYQKSFDGPCLLVRVGVPYKPNGDLNTSASPIVQPLLDGLALNGASCSSNSPSNGLYVTIASSEFYNSFAGMTINMASGMVFKFNALLPSNPGYSGNDYWNTAGNSCLNTSSGCEAPQGQSVYHFKPESYASFSPAVGCPVDICGSPSKENVFYFIYSSSQYSLSGNAGSGTLCTYDSCNVRRSSTSYSVRLSNVDALIFPDKEIRPSL